jgi:hypothetical protein
MKRLGWADDRVDPNRETMRHLNTGPNGPDFVPAALEAMRTADCYSQYAFDAAGREFIQKRHER